MSGRDDEAVRQLAAYAPAYTLYCACVRACASARSVTASGEAAHELPSSPMMMMCDRVRRGLVQCVYVRDSMQVPRVHGVRAHWVHVVAAALLVVVVRPVKTTT